MVQVVQFENHQVNLHKRTQSRLPEYPGISGNFRSNLTEFKRTEFKGTELNRTEFNQYSGEAPRTPAENVRVITAVVHELQKLGGIPAADLSEAVKGRCAELKIAYDSTTVGKAIDSMRAQKRKAVGR
jgi:hypothetical protein